MLYEVITGVEDSRHTSQKWCPHNAVSSLLQNFPGSALQTAIRLSYEFSDSLQQKTAATRAKPLPYVWPILFPADSLLHFLYSVNDRVTGTSTLD